MNIMWIVNSIPKLLARELAIVPAFFHRSTASVSRTGADMVLTTCNWHQNIYIPEHDGDGYGKSEKSFWNLSPAGTSHTPASSLGPRLLESVSTVLINHTRQYAANLGPGLGGVGFLIPFSHREVTNNRRSKKNNLDHTMWGPYCQQGPRLSQNMRILLLSPVLYLGFRLGAASI